MKCNWFNCGNEARYVLCFDRVPDVLKECNPEMKLPWCFEVCPQCCRFLKEDYGNDDEYRISVRDL